MLVCRSGLKLLPHVALKLALLDALLRREFLFHPVMLLGLVWPAKLSSTFGQAGCLGWFAGTPTTRQGEHQGENH